MTDLIKTPEYKKWLAELKNRLLKVQLKALVAVNAELLMFYWKLGAEIVHKQQESQWGDGLISQLSHDLIAEFPDMKGFSVSNLNYIRQWYLFYRTHTVIDQQLVGQLSDPDKTTLIQKITAIPWGHNWSTAC
ncbi:hypothetical protein KAI46_09140 [bacterium]|nr:hypothetical protein [bacterium]